jgi:hypothetical protein
MSIEMNKRRRLLLAVIFLSGCCGVTTGCGSPKRLVRTEPQEKRLISEYEKGWLKYKVFLLPADENDQRYAGKNEIIRLSIMVVNIKDNTSPLRKLCSNLDQYNIYYEYLLNSCKNELSLQSAKHVAYPVSYSFENNYDAFPFETINVGYRIGRSKKESYKLVYVDRVFSQDTLTFPISTKQ